MLLLTFWTFYFGIKNVKTCMLDLHFRFSLRQFRFSLNYCYAICIWFQLAYLLVYMTVFGLILVIGTSCVFGTPIQTYIRVTMCAYNYITGRHLFNSNLTGSTEMQLYFSHTKACIFLFSIDWGIMELKRTWRVPLSLRITLVI